MSDLPEQVIKVRASDIASPVHAETSHSKGVTKGYYIMATTIIVVAIAAICSKYNITPEQFDKATKVIANGRKAFYIVESLSTPGQEYRVEWNDEHQALQCKPHNGLACKASVNGLQCWHKRAALAVEEHEQAKMRARRQAEQVEIEATKAYRLERMMYELEASQAVADEWEQSRRVAASIEAARKWAGGGAQTFGGSDVSEMKGFYCGVEA
jgi:hypothetical protein